MQDQDCINAAIRVLKEEAQGILDLVPHVGEEFARACRLILGCRGKVILTGVGKSGHIATKIASSLASTGTQSFFVESAEAAHGDLGMIGHGDVVIAVSNSGESSELRTMIASLRLRRIPLIAICGNPHSSLGEAADIFLNAHVEKEACPLNLAPTTSSTAELAIGDALTVALIEARGFTESDFAVYHPGGALGRRLLVRCKDLMHDGKSLPVVPENASIKETLIEMTQKSLGMVAVIHDDGTLAGVFTDGDVRRSLEKEVSLNAPVKSVMTAHCTSLTPMTLAADAMALMQEKRIHAMVVVDENRHPIGAFNMHDLIQAGFIENGRENRVALAARMKRPRLNDKVSQVAEH